MRYSMKFIIYASLFIASINACNPSSDLDKKVDHSSDTLVVRHKCAVQYSPDLIAREKLKVELGEAAFLQASEDYHHFMRKATIFLDLAHLKIIEAKGKKYIRFLYSDKSQRIIELENLPNPWGLIFFDGSKTPKTIDITLVEMEYANYF
jgi:hypothetical protein